jgi:hypothetical protein
MRTSSKIPSSTPVLAAACAVAAAARPAPDRTLLPIAEPRRPADRHAHAGAAGCTSKFVDSNPFPEENTA